MKFVVALLGLWFATTTHAEPLTPNDFASGLIIETDGNAAIYKITVPDSVFKTAVREDLGDIRIFNKSNQRVPHAVQQPERDKSIGSKAVPLPYFPLFTPEKRLDKSPNLDISMANDGTIIDIKSRGALTSAKQPEIYAYVLDASAIDSPIDELSLHWDTSKRSLITAVSLETSNDLNRWRKIVKKATIAALTYSGHKLRKDRITLPRTKTKYLRLSWLDDNKGIQLDGVEVITTNKPERERERLVVAGQRATEGMQNYDFDTGGVFPVERIEIGLDEPNTFTKATVKSRANPDDNWQTRFSGLFYNLRVKGNSLVNDPIRLSTTTTHRYWRLEAKTGGGLGEGLPKLKIDWVPNEVLFLARGQGPYTLAFGSAKVNAIADTDDALLDILSKNHGGELVGHASIGSEIELGGDAALLPLPKTIPWERATLWVILVFAVAVLGVMTFRLLRQMNSAGKPVQD